MSVRLCGSFGTRVGAADGKVWNLLFPKGEWHGANLAPIGGSIVIDDAMLSEMVANWRGAGSPKLPIRRTHLHLDDAVPLAEKPELEAAYGLLEDFRVTADGLEALTDWNEAGRGEVRSGRFNFWSPEWQPKHVDRRTGDVKGWWLSGTALTNDPFFNSMPRVAASSSVAPTSSPQPKEAPMTPELKKRLKMALKCAEECSDEEMVASCEKMTAAIAASVTETASLTAAVKSAVEPMQAQLVAAQAEAATLKASLVERDTTRLIDDAKLAGKPVESMRAFIVAAAKRDMAEATALVAALPVSMSTAEKGISGTPAPESVEPVSDGTLTASAVEYFTKLEAFAAAEKLTTVQATRLFNRDNADLAKRAFAVTR
jgi:hypothetical protein